MVAKLTKPKKKTTKKSTTLAQSPLSVRKQALSNTKTSLKTRQNTYGTLKSINPALVKGIPYPRV